MRPVASYIAAERCSIVTSPDGSYAAILETERVVVIELAHATTVAEVGVATALEQTDVAWICTPPRLLILSRRATNSTVHLIDLDGPRVRAEIQIEGTMRIGATVGAHALVIGSGHAGSSAVLTAGEAHLTPYLFPGRSLPTAAGAAGRQFVVAIPGAIEEWDPQQRTPRKRMRLPRQAVIAQLGGTGRVVWMTTQQEPARIDVIAQINSAQPKFHDLPEPIAHVSAHPLHDLLACVGRETGSIYVVDLGGRTPTRTLNLEGLGRAAAAALFAGTSVGVVAARAGKPLGLFVLESHAAIVTTPAPPPIFAPAAPPPHRAAAAPADDQRSSLYEPSYEPSAAPPAPPEASPRFTARRPAPPEAPPTEPAPPPPTRTGLASLQLHTITAGPAESTRLRAPDSEPPVAPREKRRPPASPAVSAPSPAAMPSLRRMMPATPTLPPVDEGLNFEFLKLNQQWAASVIDAHLAGAAADPDVQGALIAALEELSVHDGIPFFALARRSSLTPLESQVVGLCLAQMIEPDIGRALARLHAHGRPQLTPADVALLLLGNSPDARAQILMLLSAESRLRCSCILEAPQLAWDGLIDSPLYLTRPCLAYLTGQALHAPHYRFTCFAHDEAPPPRRAVVSEQLAEQIYGVIASQAASLHRGDAASAADTAGILLLLWGPAGAGKATFARELAPEFFSGLVEIDGEALAQLKAPPALLREALDCAVIHGAMLLVENGQALLSESGTGRFLLDALRASPACVVVTSTERELGQTLEGAWSLVTHFARPAREMGVELWKSHLPPGTPLAADVDLEALRERYVLSGAAIARAARMALAYASADPERGISMALLEQAAAAQLDDNMGELVRTVFPRHQLDDLILPVDDLLQIKDMIAAYNNWHHVMGRWGMGNRLATGKCITGLFYGEPGTGKSFAAEVIAGVVGQPLRIVNLSNILSKWMGETERNIHDLFERGRLNNSLLLFDEADALFSSRVEVRSAQDHAMNMMTGQLLQELDRHTGLVIMTTNLTENIDPAFRRRILFCLEFTKPDQDARWRIWQRLIPSQTPCAPDVDLKVLAKSYALSGGEIKNAVLRAALTAYGDGSDLTQMHLMDACEREYKNTGRLLQDPRYLAQTDRAK